jgi:small-conductance mechanosensitive channel
VGASLLVLLLSFENDIVGLSPPHWALPVRLGLVVAAALAGTFGIRNAVAAATRGLDRQAAVVVRNLSTWTLYVMLALGMASALGLNLSGLLLGGAILGVIVGTAAQSSLGNFFAGLLLMLGRPYRVGAALRLRGPDLAGGEYEGTVTDMGALYTTLTTAQGEILKVPNRAVVSSALVLGEAPLQADLELELPPGTPLRPIDEALRARLGSAAGVVSIRPKLVGAGSEGRLVCSVQVRSAEAIEPGLLAEALLQSVEGVRALR